MTLTRSCFTIVLLIVGLTNSSLAVRKCPAGCSCNLDMRGRNVVYCGQGGLQQIPFRDMSLDTEVIIVSAPEYKMNTLAMDPNFEKFPNLEELHITRSNIPELSVHLFFTLKKLEVLNLSQNNITQPLPESFRGLRNLKELNLDDNRIYSLSSGTFRYLTSLRTLSLQRNRIQEMTTRMFELVGRLQVLKLSGNFIRNLNPESFKDVLQELRVFECRGCSLTNINPEVYGFLPHLTHLDLGYNEFENIAPEDLCNLTTLKVLKLDGNRISELRNDTFFYASELRKLNLAKNRIAMIDTGAFGHFQNLTELDLGYNKLEYIPAQILLPLSDSLQKLSLAGNHIPMEILRAVLQAVPCVRELILTDSSITELPVGLIPEGVVRLILSRNLLVALEPDPLPNNLIELDLTKNRFRGLHTAVLEKMERIMKLRLEENPWACDLCHIIPMLERVNRSMTLSSVKCYYPYHLEGRALATLQVNELNWCTAEGYTDGANFFLAGGDEQLGVIAASTTIFILAVIIIAVIITFVYSRRHAAKYYTHEEKRSAETEAIVDGAFFGDERELSFKFPIEGEKKISIATIDDEFRKDPSLLNGEC